MREVAFPEGLSSIAPNCFFDSGIVAVCIPSTVSAIGKSAFENCGNLETVTFESGSSLRQIEDQVFVKCKKLKNINLPEGLVDIGIQSFCDTGFKEIKIPKTVQVIQKSAFESCIYLENINFAEGSVLKTVGDSALFKCSKLHNIELP